MTNDLDNLIARYESDPSLFDADELRRRIEALDALDASLEISSSEQIRARLRLRARLERANSAIYNSIRNEVQKGGPPTQLLHWIEHCSASNSTPQPGLGYDTLDELISGVLQAREPDTPPTLPQPEMVFYQPTPARHILQLIRLCALSETDTLVDLGSGLGHVPILASILTRAHSIGIEAERAHVASARECADRLHLNHVTFIHQNASDANLAGGTVFYLYTPFTGNTLNTVLQKLRQVSDDRSITVCTLGPCTLTTAMEPWLTATTAPDPNQITVFRSNP